MLLDELVSLVTSPPLSLAFIVLSPFANHTEKAMASHSSTLAWKISWMEKPGRLQSMESLPVGHD